MRSDDDRDAFDVISNVSHDSDTLIQSTSQGKKSRLCRKSIDQHKAESIEKTNKNINRKIIEMRKVDKILDDVDKIKKAKADDKLNHYYMIPDDTGGNDDSMIIIDGDDEAPASQKPSSKRKNLNVSSVPKKSKTKKPIHQTKKSTGRYNIDSIDLRRIKGVPRPMKIKNLVSSRFPRPPITQIRAPAVPFLNVNELSEIAQISNEKPTKKKTGAGIEADFIPYNENIVHEFYDDPNELVERLHLLMASRAAGNTNHAQEINSIVTELREAGIIE